MGDEDISEQNSNLILDNSMIRLNEQNESIMLDKSLQNNESQKLFQDERTRNQIGESKESAEHKQLEIEDEEE